MTGSWTKYLESNCIYKYVLPQFLEHLNPLQLQESEVQGVVLIAGQASACPERTLVCRPKYFDTPRIDIKGLYFCDTSYPSSPKTHLKVECVNSIGFAQLPKPRANTAFWELSSLDTLLDRAGNIRFDTVMMFRAVDTGEQIVESGLVEKIAPHLSDNGLVILTGGRFPDKFDDSAFSPLKVLRKSRLSDYSDGYPFSNNWGVVLSR